MASHAAEDASREPSRGRVVEMEIRVSLCCTDAVATCLCLCATLTHQGIFSCSYPTVLYDGLMV